MAIDASDPNKVIGNAYTAQISPTRSTLFTFDVPPSTSSQTCNLTFAVPPAFDPTYIAPLNIAASGGLSVSSLGKSVNAAIGANLVVGTVPNLIPGNKYTLASAPCEAGQRVGYKADSLNGLDITFFQMASPALGLFLEAHVGGI